MFKKRKTSTYSTTTLPHLVSLAIFSPLFKPTAESKSSWNKMGVENGPGPKPRSVEKSRDRHGNDEAMFPSGLPLDPQTMKNEGF